jgi:hypothetical protein
MCRDAYKIATGPRPQGDFKAPVVWAYLSKQKDDRRRVAHSRQRLPHALVTAGFSQ